MSRTHIVMIASSGALFLAAVACLFAPVETLSVVDLANVPAVAGQMLGALYLGFAAANWTARGSMIGGVYARPLSMANFVHFLVGAIVLAKGISAGTNAAYSAVTLCYLVFAVLFILMLYGRLQAPDRAQSGQ